MDQSTFMKQLRAELTLSADLSHADRIAALETAFTPERQHEWAPAPWSESDSALTYLLEGDDKDYFGEQAFNLASTGLHYRVTASHRPGFVSGVAKDWLVGLRMQAYTYAVVGYVHFVNRQQPQKRAVQLVLRMTPRLLYGEATGVLSGMLETLKVRAGLMNKRQARLLADHLNGLEKSKEDSLAFTWEVTSGPTREDSVRRWLDCLQPQGPLLRRELGEAAAWGLGPTASASLATYRLENGTTVNSDQAFSSEPPRIVLPPRFLLECFPPEEYDPNPCTSGIAAHRHAPCQQSAQLFTFLPDSRLRDEDSWALGTKTSEVMDEIDRFFTGDSEDRPYNLPSHTYPLALSHDEVARASQYLQASRSWSARAVRVGTAGYFNPLHICETILREVVTVPGPEPFELAIFSYSA